MPRTAYSVTLHVHVNSRAELHAAAKAQALADGVTNTAELIGTKRRPDVPACLRMLLDPGMSPPGLSIIDSDVSDPVALD